MIESIILYIITFAIICIAIYGPAYAVKKHLHHLHQGKKEITVKDCVKFIYEFLKFTAIYPIYYFGGKREIFKWNEEIIEFYNKHNYYDHVDIIVVIYKGIYSYKNIAVFCSG